jgi:hypothetical protein
MKKTITRFAGITRHTDDTVSNDGECSELINLRVKNGLLQPVAPPKEVLVLPNVYERIFKHTGSAYENYICYKSGVLEAFLGSSNSLRPLLQGSDIASIKGIRATGNILQILTETDIIHFLFKNGEYVHLGSKPEFPVINFVLYENSVVAENNYCDINPDIVTIAGTTYTFDTTNRTLVTNTVLGGFNKLISDATTEGYFVFPVLVRYALRLFDGSYILHSPPVLLLTRRKKTVISEMVSVNGPQKLENFTVATKVYKNILRYSANYDLSGWEDVISSVDIFVSPQIKTIDLNSDIETFTTKGTGMELNISYPGDDKIKEDILAASIFYKIHSLSLTQNTAGTSIQKNGMLDNLEQKETLSDDSFTHNEITGVSFVYNSRLHVANVKSKLSPLYNPAVFANINFTAFDTINALWSAAGDIEVHINTGDGTKVIHSQFALTTFDFYGFTPMLSYPDYRAVKIVMNIISGGVSYYKVFDLKPHPFLNLAYHIDKLNATGRDQFAQGAIRPAEINDDIEYSGNKIKVSEVNNPFYFPAKNTYTVSSGEIIAIGSNTAPISEGQFGQYPLYIFTSDGIYSLSPGGDGVLYAVSAPIARDVATNPSVLPIDNAVIFMTEQGLMAISGRSVDKLSSLLDGQPVIHGSIAKKIISISAISGTESKEEFHLYLKGASLGFNYAQREILVSNPEYSYSYVYNIVSQTWHKQAVGIDGYVDNAYPECLSFAGNIISNMENRDICSVNVALISRPVKFGSLDHKRIAQAAVRGLFHTGKIGFYILGSNDTRKFTLLAGKETKKNMRDLIACMNRSKACKYFAAGISGSLRSDSFINYTEYLTEESFDNRIR